MRYAPGIIVGGGIGGLCTAIALQRKGIEVRVYEATPALRPIGAGIVVAPNGMTVFERLGMADAVRERGVPVERMQLFDHKGSVLHSSPGQDLVERFGNPIVAIQRASLHQVLLDHVNADTVVLGKRCMSVRHEGDTVRVAFDDDTEASGPFLIAADGLRSVVRQQLFPSARLRYAGETCWRGLARCALPPEFHHASAECWGVGKRFGFLAVGAEQVYWYATRKTVAGGSDDQELKQRLLELYGRFMPPIPTLLEDTPAHLIVRHDLYDLTTLAEWGEGRVALLGDAAHAPTPNLGQGGCQAMEDAWVVAKCLSGGHDVAAAFKKYAALRKPKANRIVRDSWRFGRLAGIESPTLRAARNLLIRLTPEFVAGRQLASIFRMDD